MSMKCVDLFAGCGGLSLGFMQAGFEVLAACDSWEAALTVYRKNFNHDAINVDLKQEDIAIETIARYRPDMIIGGPPCQDFSSAGKRDTTLGRADLTQHFANIVCAIKPRWFVMENVEQIKKIPLLRKIIEQFTTHQYGMTSVILDAAYCNVPQSRTRFFLIGHLHDQHNQLLPILQCKLNQKPLTLRQYFGDTLSLDYYYRHPRNYNRRGVFTLDEPSPTIRGVNRPIPPNYQLNSCDPQNIDLSKVRPLTTLERSYIQTFPRSFQFTGTKTNLEQMIGNAVPVNLAQFVAQAIKDYNEQPSLGELFLFPETTPFQLAERPLHRT